MSQTTADYMNMLAYFLPKSYQGRAKVVMHYLAPHVRLTKKDRIIYPDGTIGSHILDLVKYTVSVFDSEQPDDASKFIMLLKEIGVPDMAIVDEKKRL